jgi:broad-specificity NMP kinase
MWWFYLGVGFWLGVGAVVFYRQWEQWADVSGKQISYKEPDETAQEVIDEIESLSVMRRRSSHPRWMREVKDIIESTGD